jgi:radical SAM superfamily enzyme YgiQ (UPF0313 family)
MKTVILSINSKYIHTLLAPRYLKANCVGLDVEIIESNINVRLFDLLSEVYLFNPDVIAISCYIFNIEFVRNFLAEIKSILPDVTIILGGYEVAFDEKRYLPLCNYIIKGEGDLIFNELLHDIKNNTKKFKKIIEAGTIKNLNDIITPFSEEYCLLGKDKILYMETSRGCPFCCSYCMSANTHGVRTFGLDRIFNDLNKIMKYQPKQIKFVDRTFNYDIKRAIKIFEFIITNFSNSKTNFHFEMAPELFNEEMFNILLKAKKGLFQFEIGIQSYNKDTLKNVGRNANIDVIEANITKLIEIENINIHVDLIAGLPLENLDSFIKGFNRLFLLKPDCLQLGFLKILKGSLIYNQKSDFITYTTPPYEIISTPMLSFNEILKLKTAEEKLELYYNSGRFNNSIDFLIPNHISPYSFFYEIGEYYKNKGYNKCNISAFYQCELLYNFAIDVICNKKEKTDKENFIKELEQRINDDYANSGNIRKWKKTIK